MKKSVWNIFESGILIEAKVYRGQAQVRYADLVKLFDYLGGTPKSNISTWDPRDKNGQPPPVQKRNNITPGGAPAMVDPRAAKADAPLPAREGGFADVDMKVVPKVWNRWASSLDTALALAASGDQQHPERTNIIPTANMYGRKGTSVSVTDMGKNPRPGVTGDENPEVTLGHARPDALYDFVAVADMEGFTPSPGGVTDTRGAGRETTITVRRIAWTPSIGSADARRARLRDLMAGKNAPVKAEPKKPSELGKPPAPADQGYNPLAGQTAKSGMFQNKNDVNNPVGTYPGTQQKAVGGLPPPIGTPERDEWEMSRPPGKQSKKWLDYKKNNGG